MFITNNSNNNSSSNNSNTNNKFADLSKIIAGINVGEQIKKIKRLEQKPKSTFNFGKCEVCKDRATGVHYGIPTCEGCKGFFKRSIEKNETYVCNFGYRCDITPQQRNRCKYCRLKACLEAGMSFNAIKMGRIPKAEKEKAKRLHELEKQRLLEERESNAQTFEFYSNKVNNPFKFNDLSFFKALIESSKLISKNLNKDYFLDIKNQEDLLVLKLLRDKCIQLYNEHNYELKEQYNTVIDLYNKNRSNIISLNADNLPIDEAWKCNLTKLEEYIKTSILYAKQLPGFESLSASDFKKTISDRIFILISMRISRLLINEEYYFFISENLYLSLDLMKKIYGDKIAEHLLLSFFSNFNNLNLTDGEIAVFIPYALTTFDQYFEHSDEIKELNNYYTRVFLYELSLNNRDKKFFEKLNETYALLPQVNKMTSEVNLQVPVK